LKVDTISDNPAFASADEFLKAVKAWDKRGPKRWGYYIGTINGKRAHVKTYGRSYPQILEADGIRYGGKCDMKPTAFEAEIRHAFS
jgi:hypothetical protein